VTKATAANRIRKKKKEASNAMKKSRHQERERENRTLKAQI